MALWDRYFPVWVDHLWGILNLLLIPQGPLLVHTCCLLCESLGGNPGSLELSLLLSSIHRCQKGPKSSHCSPVTDGSVQKHSKIGIMERIHFHVSSYLPLFILSRMGPSMNVPGSFLPNPASSQRLHFLFWELKTPSTSRKCDWWELNRPQYFWVLPFCLPSHPRLCKLQAWCWEAVGLSWDSQNTESEWGGGSRPAHKLPHFKSGHQIFCFEGEFHKHKAESIGKTTMHKACCDMLLEQRQECSGWVSAWLARRKSWVPSPAPHELNVMADL